nr:glycosyltransferase family 4 protein [Nocardioides mesophilus]
MGLRKRDHVQGPPSFLVASRWNLWKGHGTLLNAWELCQTSGYLRIVGGPPPLGEGFDVPAAVDANRRQSQIEIVGEVESLLAALDDTDVLIVPSDAPEPFGLVAIEAFSRGVPVIASAGGGLDEVMREGEEGWFFERGSAVDLARVIDRLTLQMMRRAGEISRRTYESKFALPGFQERVLQEIALVGGRK